MLLVCVRMYSCGVLVMILTLWWNSISIRWELKDKNFPEIDNICLDDIINLYWLVATKINENFTATDLVTAFE